MDLPAKIAPFINLERLEYPDKLDLLIISTEALKQIQAGQYYSMPMQGAIEESRTLKDSFDGIEETDEFLAVTLTELEWVNLLAATLISMKNYLLKVEDQKKAQLNIL
jgi:hypothetical protein